MPRFYDLIQDLETAKRREATAKERADKASSEWGDRYFELEAAEKRLANALHLLGKPVEWAGTTYRLCGVGSRLRVEELAAVSAYTTDVPELPADLAAPVSPPEPPPGVGDEGLGDTFPSVALAALDEAIKSNGRPHP
jgi:hypothetical protein